VTYSLIPENEREKFHYRIGVRLWCCFDINELDANIFVVVGQLVAGSKFIVKENERIAVAKLCLRAGERSVYMSSFQSAFKYLVQGVQLLTGTQCWRDEYTLTLDLYNAAAEVAYSSGHLDEVHVFVKELLAHATCLEDTLRGHAAKVYAIGSSGRMQEAIHYGIQILGNLGETFPARENLARTLFELQRLRKKLKKITNESVLRLPMMEDTRKVAAMHMLSQLLVYTYLNQKMLSLKIAFRMVNISLDCGLSATSCVGFVLVGVLLCG
jgi:predicted ATPase